MQGFYFAQEVDGCMTHSPVRGRDQSLQTHPSEVDVSRVLIGRWSSRGHVLEQVPGQLTDGRVVLGQRLVCPPGPGQQLVHVGPWAPGGESIRTEGGVPVQQLSRGSM